MHGNVVERGPGITFIIETVEKGKKKKIKDGSSGTRSPPASRWEESGRRLKDPVMDMPPKTGHATLQALPNARALASSPQSNVFVQWALRRDGEETGVLG